VNTLSSLYIIIPVFNGWPQTRRCLEAIRQNNYPDARVIVVDHGSTDGTKTELPNEFEEVIIVLGSEDLWWTGATNLGIQEALRRGAETIMLLNNDCYLEPDTIKKLVNHLKQSGEAVIAPIQKDMVTGEIAILSARTAIWAGFPTIHSNRNFESVIKRVKEGLLKTQLICGGRGVLIPKSVFKKVGVFDENEFPHYHADHDFYLRCRKEGIPLYIAVDTIVLIDNERTSSAQYSEMLTFSQFFSTFKDMRSHRNIHYLSRFFRKHYPVRGLYFIGLWLNIARYAMGYALRRSVYLLRGLSMR
jgi:GT2 family glycosyltransferase